MSAVVGFPRVNPVAEGVEFLALSNGLHHTPRCATTLHETGFCA